MSIFWIFQVFMRFSIFIFFSKQARRVPFGSARRGVHFSGKLADSAG
jgi:hypothetical protein